MNEEVREALGQKQPTKFHEAILEKCRSLVDGSRRHMCHYYDGWDTCQDVYDATRKPDRLDVQASRDREPKKMVVPLTYAQINTFIAFCFMLLGQRKRLFELEATGAEDHDLVEVSEKVLARDLRHNQFALVLFQFFLDLGRFGLGVVKHGWVEEKLFVKRRQATEVMGQELEVKESYVAVRAFEGNRVQAVSPYKFFPDCRLPLTRFQEGEFCATEDEYTKVRLQELEAFGECAGVEQIEPFDGLQLAERRERSRFTNINLDDPTADSNMVCVTEVQVKLVPAEFEIEPGKKLGKEKFPVKFLVWYANDCRVIRLEEMNYAHGKFTVESAQFTPDMHKQLNKSLSSVIEMLQETVDWFTNARVASVRRTLDNQLVVDPAAVDMTTVENRSRVILLKKGVSRTGIDRYIYPLPVQDVTSGHIQDVQHLIGVTQMTTSISENVMGNYHGGRRSATEARVVNQGAAGRLSMIAKLVWDGAIAPLGHAMLTNARQSMSQETFEKIVGLEKVQVYQLFVQPLEVLAANEDVFVFDGTLPSEKAYLAQSLQEILAMVLQNPQAALMLGIGANELLREIYELRGVTGLSRFAPKQDDMTVQLLQMMQQQPQQQGAQVQQG